MIGAGATLAGVAEEVNEVSEELNSFEVYKLYLQTAEKVSDRRAEANKWMLSVNGTLVSFYCYLSIMPEGNQREWLVAIAIAGIVICFAWAALLASYRRLNSAKFAVLQELESEMRVQPFQREELFYLALGRRSLARLETIIPGAFTLLYLIFVILRLFLVSSTE